MAVKITFLASFPPIQSAIKIGQDGARIQLDIPETELAKFMPGLLLRDRILRVTIEDEDGRYNH